ncbi:alpha/beta hydrolase [Microbacterium aurantiacum]|uniref:alpha/beta hydrolase n=1 Tax=Microbacterium aurantiacum TaxID=162393 RepID=UPI001C63BCBF|nr:alpha/beta hydrolase [Microbacterium aurantiacum]
MDPEIAAVLAPHMDHFGRAITAETFIPLLRLPNPFSPELTDEDLRRDGAFTVSERTIPGPAGSPDVDLLICTPAGAPFMTSAIYFSHGGGMVAGTIRSGLSQVLDWAQDLRSVVISVGYRLAPETPHPGPAEDCYAGLVWIAEHAAELGIDPSRIVVAGDSAGGGLSAAISLMSRDRGGPEPVGQMLISPMLDDRLDSVSSHQIGPTVWSRPANTIAWTALLGGARGGPDVSPYAAPARASDLTGLPPAYLDVGTSDIFRDETVSYASRLWEVGVQAELHAWPGGAHGFDVYASHAQLSQDARAARIRWLRRLLAP